MFRLTSEYRKNARLVLIFLRNMHELNKLVKKINGHV